MPKRIMSLHALAPDLWIVDAAMPMPKGMFPFAIPAFFGAASLRMTVVRLSSGGLLLHSPVAPTPALVDEVKALGPVELIVGPCVMHTTFLRPWHALHERASLHVAPRTKKRLPAFDGVRELDDAAPIAPNDLEQVHMDGHSNHETLFLHRASRTLIATDLVYNLSKRQGFVERMWFGLGGVKNPLGVTRYSKKAVRKRDVFAERMQRVLAWDFDRVIMSHGDVVETDGKTAFTRAWQPT
jgi:glyoxylase-like metal-dependent hydrolase (beta-lactamase superfamily II)